MRWSLRAACRHFPPFCLPMLSVLLRNATEMPLVGARTQSFLEIVLDAARVRTRSYEKKRITSLSRVHSRSKEGQPWLKPIQDAHPGDRGKRLPTGGSYSIIRRSIFWTRRFSPASRIYFFGWMLETCASSCSRARFPI